MAMTVAEHKAVPESKMNAASLKQSVHLLMRTTPVGLAFVLLFAVACQRQHVDASTPRKAAQAFVEALMRNDLAQAKSLAIGSDVQLATMQVAVEMGQVMDRFETAKAKRFKNGKVESMGPDWLTRVASAEERIEGDTAKLIRNSKEIFVLQKSGSIWKIDLSAAQATTPEEFNNAGALIKGWRELAKNIERGKYKSEEELDADLAHVFETVVAEGSPSPAVAQQQQIAQPDSSTPKKAALAFIHALESNDMKVARALAIGADKELADWKRERDFDVAIVHTNAAVAKRFGAGTLSDTRTETGTADSKLRQKRSMVIRQSWLMATANWHNFERPTGNGRLS